MVAGTRLTATALMLASLLALSYVWGSAPLGASAMTFDRANHTATRLLDGRVLVTGGATATGAEIYDPAADAWSLTGSMRFSRTGHAAVRLLDGRVFVVGGANALSAEIYDPATGRWADTATMDVVRVTPGAALLPDGRVLVVGGASGEASNTIYDPAADRWSPAAPNPAGPFSGSPGLEVLPDGRVLVVDAGYVPRSIVELYNPPSDSWSVLHLGVTLFGLSSAPLPGGRVLIVGAAADPSATLLALVLDPANSAITPAATPPFSRGNSIRTPLPGGRLLFLVNNHLGVYPQPSSLWAFVYDPAADRWLVARGPAAYRAGFTATLLESGLVLLAGGNLAWGGLVQPQDSELYDPAASILGRSAYLPLVGRQNPVFWGTPTIFPTVTSTHVPGPSPTPRQSAGNAQIVDVVLKDPAFPRESEEYVQIVNYSLGAVDLTGWRLLNVSRPDGTRQAVRAFEFPAFTLAPNVSAVVFSRQGDDDPAIGDFFWDQAGAVWVPGDRAELQNSAGVVVSTFVVSEQFAAWRGPRPADQSYLVETMP